MTKPLKRMPPPQPRSLAQPGSAVTPAGAPASPPSAGPASPPSASPASPRVAPERPALANANAAPVLTKVPPPVSVRLSQLSWVLSFFAGGVALVYFFIIREKQLPLIAEMAKTVTEGRSEETYTAAADIIYWSMFTVIAGILLVQITLLVSFTNRRPNTRWWQLGTFVAQALLYLLGLELVASGDDGVFLRQLLIAQCGLVLLGLLFSTMPGALHWTARKHDIRRGSAGDGGEL